MTVVYNDLKSSLIAYQMHRMKKQRFVFIIKLLLTLVVPILIISTAIISVQIKGFRTWVMLTTLIISITWIIFIRKTFVCISIKIISAFIPDYESHIEISINEKRIHYKDCNKDIHSEAILQFKKENDFLTIQIDNDTEVLLPLDKLNKEEQNSFIFYLSRLQKS